MAENDDQGRPVPTGRLTRMARMGGLAATVAGRAALSGAGTLARGQRPQARDLLLTPDNALRLTRQLSQMRGAAMKLGQLLSMEAGDFLPPEWAAIMARLRDQAEFMPARQVKQVLIAAYGPDFLTRFRHFGPRPIAAASIGQVHRATAADGRDLAVKLQYPGIARSIDSDLRNVAALIRLSRLLPADFDLDPLIDEARRQLQDEADYDREAWAMSRFADLLAGSPAFVLPRPCPDLAAPGVLAMDYLPGEPIESLASAPQALRDDVMARLIGLTLREVFEFRLIQSDPNFANFRWQPGGGRIVLLDFGATRTVAPDLAARLRRLLSSGLANRGDLEEAATETGYLHAAMPAADRARLMAMIRDALQPFGDDRPFDFAASDLPNRMRDLGLDHARHRQGLHVPPMDLMFIQRKVAGLYLLGARLGARVNLRPLVAPHVDG